MKDSTEVGPAPLIIHLWDEVNLGHLSVLDTHTNIDNKPTILIDGIIFELCFQNIPLDGSDQKTSRGNF